MAVPSVAATDSIRAPSWRRVFMDSSAFSPSMPSRAAPGLMHPHVAVILHALVYLRSHLTEMTDRPSNEVNKEPACDAADASPEKARPVQNVAHWGIL